MIATAPAPATPPPGAEQPPPSLRVRWEGEDRFAVDVRGHSVVVDQPADVGGADSGPTPTELFVASLASCVAFYARRYLRRHDLDATGLEVRTRFEMGTRPSRVGSVAMEIVLPLELPEARARGLLAQAAHCTVHNSLEQPPGVDITLTREDTA